MSLRTIRRLAGAAILASTMIISGCGADPAPPTVRADVVYQLTEVNGQALPAVLGENSTGKEEVLDESYTLEADGTYRRVQDYRNTDAAGVKTGTLTQTGTYIATADLILFTFVTNEGTYVTRGTVNGESFTVNVPTQGVTLVYRKQ
jgi:hypothetical protein